MTDLKTEAFDYDLPPALIAQTPCEPRDASRLMVVDRAGGTIAHARFRDLLDYLRPGDMLVANDSRVMRARLLGRKASGGRVEVLLLRQVDDRRWEALVGGKRMRPGGELRLEKGSIQVKARVVEALGDARRIVEFEQPITSLLAELGEMPLPPYTHEPLRDPERYQTVFSRWTARRQLPPPGCILRRRCCWPCASVG